MKITAYQLRDCCDHWSVNPYQWAHNRYISKRGARKLAAQIMAQAVRDWRKCKHIYFWPLNWVSGNREWPRAEFKSPRAELIAFFKGEWYELMADEMSIDPEYSRQQLGIK